MKEFIIKPWCRLIRQWAFVVCVLVLGLCAGGLQIGAQKLKWHFRKLPLPLAQWGKPLAEMDVAALQPYRLLRKIKVAKEVEEELGTKEYIHWQLEDVSVDKNDPARYATVFVTYYTGNPDKVPHVPDWCYVGGGGIVKEKRNTSIMVPGCGLEGKGDKLGIRLLRISMPGELRRQMMTVMYFFAVNGQYCLTRDAVRHIQNNLSDRYTYFSKVELSFVGAGEITTEESLAAAEKLARVVVPLLWEEHWPDWKKVKKAEKKGS